jgi:hypothetical protein
MFAIGLAALYLPGALAMPQGSSVSQGDEDLLGV